MIQKRLLNLPNRFVQLTLFQRTIILSIASVLLAFPTCFFIEKNGVDCIKSIIGLEQFENRANLPSALMSFDILVCIVIAFFFACILHLLMGTPNRPSWLLKKLEGHPIITFVVFTSVLVGWLSTVPTVFSSLWVNLQHETIPLLAFKNLIYKINPLYMRSAALAALCLGLSITDIVMSPKKYPYNSILFIGLSFLLLCPILWWNAMVRLMPSRFWQGWRIVLLFATCLGPILIFPKAQPIVHYEIKSLKPAKQVLKRCNKGYSFERTNNAKEVLLHCKVLPRTINRYKRNAEDLWVFDARQEMNKKFRSKEFQVDFKRNLIYAVNGELGEIYTYDLDALKHVSTINIPNEIFPISNHRTLMSFNPKNDLLAIAERNGFFFIVDVKDFHVVKSGYLTERGLLWGLDFDTDNDQLFLFQSYRLTALSSSDFHVVNSVSFSDRASAMFYSDSLSNVLIAFPDQMTVWEVNRKTLKVVNRFDAPLGVRRMEYDPSRNLIFLTSLSGIIEVINYENFKTEQRIKTNVDIKGIKLYPEFGEAFVATGEKDIIVWQYDPKDIEPDMFKTALYLFERTFRWLLEFSSKNKPQNDITRSKDIDLHTESTLLVFAKEQKKDKEFTSDAPQHYNVIMTYDEQSFCKAAIDNINTIDIVLIDEKSPPSMNPCFDPIHETETIPIKYTGEAY